MLNSKKSKNFNKKHARASNFAPYKKKYLNPYFQAKKRHLKISFPAVNLKLKIFFYLFFILIIIGLWQLFFSPYFTIRNIEIDIIPPDDNNIPPELRIDPDIIRGIALELAGAKLFKIIPQNNIFLYDKDRLYAAAGDFYNYEYITLEKKPFNTIKIIIKEKNYAILFKEKDKIYYVDINKNIISEAESEIDEEKKYPLIENRGASIISENRINLDNIDFIISLYGKIVKELTKYNIEKIIITGEPDSVNIKIKDGPEIYFDSSEDLDAQINKLIVLIRERLKDEFINKTYINIKYGDRVYYR